MTNKHKKVPIADAGDFVSHALGMLDPSESIQPTLIEEDIAAKHRAEARESMRRSRRKTRALIYFVQELSSDKLVKIGYTDRIETRFPTLYTGTPHGVILLGAMDGSLEAEKALHKQFEAHRYHCEWFRPAPELLEFIEQNKIEGFEAPYCR